MNTQTNRPQFKARPVRPRTFTADPRALVRCAPLLADRALPLKIESAVPDLDHLSWLADQRTWLEELLCRHGALLFRGFPIWDTVAFERFASTLCDSLYTDYGDLPPEQGSIYKATPYPPEDAILFHNESSHTHQWPLKQFFYCRTPAQSGGATPIVDCREIYQALKPEARRRFRRHGLLYVRNFIPGVDVEWRDFFKTDDREAVEAYGRANGVELEWRSDGGLRAAQWAPAVARHPITRETVFFNQIQLHHVACLNAELRKAMARLYAEADLPRHVFFGDGEPISAALVESLLRIYRERSVSFSWQRGDVLLVDNMLVSHARDPYTPPREMFVAMGDMFAASALAQDSLDKDD